MAEVYIKDSERVLTELTTYLVLIEVDGKYVLTDGWLTDWLIIYNKERGQFGVDGLFNLSEAHCQKITECIKTA